MAKDFTATIYDEARAAECQAFYGSTTVHVRSFIPEWANLPGFDKPQLVYMLDLDLLTEDQRRRLIEHISAKFNLPADEVDADLDAQGVPLLAANVVISIANPQRWIL